MLCGCGESVAVVTVCIGIPTCAPTRLTGSMCARKLATGAKASSPEAATALFIMVTNWPPRPKVPMLASMLTPADPAPPTKARIRLDDIWFSSARAPGAFQVTPGRPVIGLTSCTKAPPSECPVSHTISARDLIMDVSPMAAMAASSTAVSKPKSAIAIAAAADIFRRRRTGADADFRVGPGHAAIGQRDLHARVGARPFVAVQRFEARRGHVPQPDRAGSRGVAFDQRVLPHAPGASLRSTRLPATRASGQRRRIWSCHRLLP